MLHAVPGSTPLSPVWHGSAATRLFITPDAILALMQIAAGTSGYAYKEWKREGGFYPTDTKDLLAAYATRLPTVELNNTFYRMPKRSVVREWFDKTPPDFRFAIKASQRITHSARLNGVEQPVEYFLRAISELEDKLGAALFQLDPAFVKDAARLRAFLALLPPTLPAAFEFRHPSWLDAETFEVLASRGVALVCADSDGKQAASELARLDEAAATSAWGYLRLRRAEYSDSDLREWLKRLGDTGWEKAFVFFKHETEGPLLARRLMELSE